MQGKPVGHMSVILPASNQVETDEKAHVRAIPRSYCVSTKNGLKSILLRNINCVNPPVTVETVDPNKTWCLSTRLIPPCRPASYLLNFPGTVRVWFTVVLVLICKGLSVKYQSRPQILTCLTPRHCLTVQSRGNDTDHALKHHCICLTSSVPLILLITSHLIVILSFIDLH